MRDLQSGHAKVQDMNPNKWLPKLPLFGKHMCVHCGGAAETHDHTPPRCLLPRKLPGNFQAMTVPACSVCNNAYSNEENYVAAMIGTVGFTKGDREAVAEGGWIHSSMQRDNKLRKFVTDRLGADGVFRPDRQVLDLVHRIMKKTATGLLFFEFGRIVPPDDLCVIAVEHAKNILASALVESYRLDDDGFAEVTPSGRGLERQVMAIYGLEPKHMTKWRVLAPEYFEFMFIKRSNQKLMCAMKVHDVLNVLLECPWPSGSGPRRRGRSRTADGTGNQI
jgi:hypothetical protein